MSKIQYNWHISPSARPTWLLGFIGLKVKGCYPGDYHATEYKQILSNISNMLDEYSFMQRKLVRSCKMIKRDIIHDRSIVIYSTTGQSPLVTITFVN